MGNSSSASKFAVASGEGQEDDEIAQLLLEKRELAAQMRAFRKRLRRVAKAEMKKSADRRASFVVKKHQSDLHKLQGQRFDASGADDRAAGAPVRFSIHRAKQLTHLMLLVYYNDKSIWRSCKSGRKTAYKPTDWPWHLRLDLGDLVRRGLAPEGRWGLRTLDDAHDATSRVPCAAAPDTAVSSKKAKDCAAATLFKNGSFRHAASGTEGFFLVQDRDKYVVLVLRGTEGNKMMRDVLTDINLARQRFCSSTLFSDRAALHCHSDGPDAHSC